ncbi:phage baseplate protein [Castellaniella sp. UC4442_H9]
MSILSILTRQSATIAGYQFDAVLEDTFEASVELTRYPVESGVKVADHRIIQPIAYFITGAVSNNPLKIIDATGLIAGGLSNLMAKNPLVATIAGLSAGFLAGTSFTRASSTLQFLMDLMRTGLPFDVDAVDTQLKNMVITRLSRDRTPEVENGLVFVAEMHELVQLDRLSDFTQPGQDQLADGDPAKSGAAATINGGQQVGSAPSAATTYAVNLADGVTQQ